MEVGGQLGPLLGPHARPPLVGQVTRQPPPPRPGDERQPDDSRQHREQAAGGRPQPVLGDEEPHDPDADQDDPGRQADGDDARRSFGERRPGRRRPPGSLRLVGLTPDDRHAHGGREQRPHEGVPQPQAELTDEEHHAGGQEAEGDQVAAVGPAAPAASARRRRCCFADVRALGNDGPEGGVEDQSGAADEGEDGEGDADGAHIDVEVLGKATADARHDAVVGAAIETALVRAGHHPWMIPCTLSLHIRARP